MGKELVQSCKKHFQLNFWKNLKCFIFIFSTSSHSCSNSNQANSWKQKWIISKQQISTKEKVPKLKKKSLMLCKVLYRWFENDIGQMKEKCIFLFELWLYLYQPWYIHNDIDRNSGHYVSLFGPKLCSTLWNIVGKLQTQEGGCYLSIRQKKKRSCLVVLHRPPLIFENLKKVITV